MHPDGQLLGGRYELTSLIATGGMGQVWQARDTVLERDVAVKVLRSEYTGDPTFLARFRAEAQLAARLVHQNIATLFDYGEIPPAGPRDEHLAYLVMELVRGESLSTLLRREGRLSPERTLDVLRQSAAGLAAAHATGVVHRDVKPGNVLIGADGTVKITDFGVAVSGSSVPLTQTGQVIGTPHYLSPEQAQGDRATAASDVYALGVVGYECLAGHHAFDAESSVQVALMQIRDTAAPLPDDVPAPVRQLIAAAMVKDPAQRFPDGAAFRTAIDDVRAGRPLQPTDRTTVLPAAGAAARSPSTRVMPAVGGGAAAAGVGAVGTGAAGPAPERERESRRRRLLLPLLGVLIAAAVAVAGFRLVGGDGADDATTAPTTTEQTSPTTTDEATTEEATTEEATPSAELVEVDADDYVGEQLEDVESDLTDLDLSVTAVPRQTADADEGEVLSLSPTGELAEGTTVTVTYATAPPAPTPSSTPTSTPTPTSTSTSTPTDEDDEEESEENGGSRGGDTGDQGSDGDGDGDGDDDSGQGRGRGGSGNG